MTAGVEVPFNALKPGVDAIRPELDVAIARVLDSGFFLMGPELKRFEAEFAAYHGPSLQTVGVGSGTDAIRIGLQALGVQPGDEVLVPANAGVPPVAATVAAGGVPVFCDVDPRTHAVDPAEVARKRTNLTHTALVVHLYGQPAHIAALRDATEGLKLLEDCAQAHGATVDGRRVGTFGDAAAFSFYPTKNLGALGDGGAILSASEEVADRARLLRMYAWRHKYLSEEQATVSRLDELQAAVLGVKLPHLDAWNARRRALADRYRGALRGAVALLPPDGVFHLFVVRSPSRDALRAFLAERGVGTDIHYPVPVHVQPPFARYARGPLPETERIAREVLSLPLYPDLAERDLDFVAEQVLAFEAESRWC